MDSVAVVFRTCTVAEAAEIVVVVVDVAVVVGIVVAIAGIVVAIAGIVVVQVGMMPVVELVFDQVGGKSSSLLINPNPNCSANYFGKEQNYVMYL